MVSIRVLKFVSVIPIACFPMADWYVFLGDWLWSGKGMILAQMPNIIAGWISQCVQVRTNLFGLALILR